MIFGDFFTGGKPNSKFSFNFFILHVVLKVGILIQEDGWNIYIYIYIYIFEKSIE